MNDAVQVGRLAMCHEGDNLVAYYALTHSMSGAVFLGSIRMSAVANNPQRKGAFMGMMRDVVSDIIEMKTGIRPVWGGVVAAPEPGKIRSCPSRLPRLLMQQIRMFLS